jgi:hypothetical protein
VASNLRTKVFDRLNRRITEPELERIAQAFGPRWTTSPEPSGHLVQASRLHVVDEARYGDVVVNERRGLDGGDIVAHALLQVAEREKVDPGRVLAGSAASLPCRSPLENVSIPQSVWCTTANSRVPSSREEMGSTDPSEHASHPLPRGRHADHLQQTTYIGEMTGRIVGLFDTGRKRMADDIPHGAQLTKIT